MKAITTLVLMLVGYTHLFAAVPFERKDSQHIQEIMEAWDTEKGPWLYESLNALVMKSDFPERSQAIKETPAELIAKMDESRRNRIVTSAQRELENERNSGTASSHYWGVWINYFQRSSCTMSRGRSNGDPHLTTFDGEKYDFQTAGEYTLVESKSTPMLVQARQKRHNESVSVNSAAVMNINGDVVSYYAQDFPDMNSSNPMRINGEAPENFKETIYLKNGGVIRYNNDRHVISWPTGEQLQVKKRTFSNSALLDIDVFIPSCELQDYSGLLSDVVRIPSMNLPSAGTIARGGVFKGPRNNQDVFGNGRNNPEVRNTDRNRLRFMAEEFGDQYLVDTDQSFFELPLGILPPELRFPREYTTLSDLTDDQIREAMEQCRKAGVAEEDLMECVYDLGYVGLVPDLPPTFDDTFSKPQANNVKTEPTNVKPNRPNNNPNPVINPRRRNRGVIILPPSGGTTTNPPRQRTGGGTAPTPPRGGRTGAN